MNLLKVALVGCCLLCACSDSITVWRTTDGRQIRLDDLDGRDVLVNYWAVWCGPCREEIPELNELMTRYGDRVMVLGVNADGEEGDSLARQVEKMNIAFPQLTGDVRPGLNIAYSGILPETLVFDASGRYQRSLYGPQTVESLLVELEALRIDSQEW